MEDIKKYIDEIFENDVEIISTLHGGMMNHSFILSSNNKKYVLYVPAGNANELVDRALEKHNMELTHHLGISPRNVYFDLDKGIKVNRFIEGDSLNHVNEYNIKKIAIMLRKLHKGGVLTDSDYAPFERLKFFEKDRRKYQKNNDAYYDQIILLLNKNKDWLLKDKLCLSHNDFQKSNIIKDPDDNYWLIDMEFMSNNVDLYDVAAFGNDLVEEGEELLKAYKDYDVKKEDWQKFYLWRMFISLQWYNLAIVKHHNGEGELHNIDFSKVAEHFLENAKISYKKYHQI